MNFPSVNLICCTLLYACLHTISNCKHVSFISFINYPVLPQKRCRFFVQYRISKQLFLVYHLNYAYTSTTVDVLNKECFKCKCTPEACHSDHCSITSETIFGNTELYVRPEILLKQY